MLDRSPATGSAFRASGSEAGHAIRHRPEIDGLRAFAIVPILLLHCGVPYAKGGFVGVDIFFVISGYLITAILTREMDMGSFSLAGFYRRRIVRILPALLVMVSVTLVAGCFLLFPEPLADLGRSAAAASVFASNIYFYATSDYFAQSAEMQPLIHTWSLAVEEQFYVLYPLFLLALRGLSRRRLIAVMIGVAAVSFAIGGWWAYDARTAGFFLLPSRIWELLLGGLVAVGAYPRIESRRLRTVLCWLALAGIVFCCVVTGPGWPFPVPFALPPAAGAAFLIAYAPETSAAALLSTRPLRWIGLISYSLYLWHRPIISYYLVGRGITFTPLDSVLMLAASFAAAWLSYALVERPAQRRWRKGTGLGPHRVALAGLALFAVIGLSISSHSRQLRPLPPEVARVVSYLGFDSTPAGRAQFDTDRCFVIPTGKDFDPSCLTPATDRPNVMLIGDSHAAQLSQALRRRIAPAKLLQATAAGCRPTLVGRGLRRCRETDEMAFYHTDLSRVSAVVIAGRWFDADAGPLVDTVRYFRNRGLPVIVVGPMVEYDADMPDVLARAMMAGDPERIAALRLPDREALDRKLAPMIRAAGATYISHFPIECPGGHCRLFTATGAPVHIDHSHLSPSAAEPVAAAIAKALPRLGR